ncbi:BT1A1 protein, partial [Chordeiles acutipennis]|nr:BT1A1 protein [Chordeiles acutipennis]
PSAQMTLDPKTASSELCLLEDCKGVWWGSCKQDLPSNPERFKFHPCVLGSRGFTSGWHCWEVEVRGEGMWAVGVVKESVPREIPFPLKPDVGVWALCHSKDGYKALTSPDVTILTLHDVPQRIRVCLDYQEGRVVFLDAVSKALIFAFPQASFKGETIYPWFLVMEDAHLKLV